MLHQQLLRPWRGRPRGTARWPACADSDFLPDPGTAPRAAAHPAHLPPHVPHGPGSPPPDGSPITYCSNNFITALSPSIAMTYIFSTSFELLRRDDGQEHALIQPHGASKDCQARRRCRLELTELVAKHRIRPRHGHRRAPSSRTKPEGESSSPRGTPTAPLLPRPSTRSSCTLHPVAVVATVASPFPFSSARASPDRPMKSRSWSCSLVMGGLSIAETPTDSCIDEKADSPFASRPLRPAPFSPRSTGARCAPGTITTHFIRHARRLQYQY